MSIVFGKEYTAPNGAKIIWGRSILDPVATVETSLSTSKWFAGNDTPDLPFVSGSDETELVNYILNGLGLGTITPQTITPQGVAALGQHYAEAYQALLWLTQEVGGGQISPSNITRYLLWDLSQVQPAVYQGLVEAAKTYQEDAQAAIAGGMSPEQYRLMSLAMSSLRAAERAQTIDNAAVLAQQRYEAAKGTSSNLTRDTTRSGSLVSTGTVVLVLAIVGAWFLIRRKR